MVKLHTNYGVITLELFADKAPVTVENFKQYVRDGHYDGTIFHRVIGNFMIQGGGFAPGMQQKDTCKWSRKSKRYVPPHAPVIRTCQPRT